MADDETIHDIRTERGSQAAPGPPSERTEARPAKIAATCFVLAGFMLISVTWLARLATLRPSSAVTAGVGSLSLDRLWVLAAVAGLLGGSIRGVFVFSVDAYAYEYRLRTRQHSRWAGIVLGDAFEDACDPLHSWWSYAMKPVLGAGLGLLFGLLQLAGLIPFLGHIDGGDLSQRDAVRLDAGVAVVAILAGILTEDVVTRIKKVFGPKISRPIR